MKYPVLPLLPAITTYNQYLISGKLKLGSAQAEVREIPSEKSTLDAEEALMPLEAGAQETASAITGLSSPKSRQADVLEAKFAVDMLHPTLSQFPVSALGDLDFWRFITFRTLESLVISRERFSKGYLGLDSGSPHDCTALSMFNRAELSIEHAPHLNRAASDLYAIGNDFWRSHILRVANRYDPALVRALLQRGLEGALTTDQIRPVARDLRARRASLFLGCLNDEESLHLLDESREYVASRDGA